MAPSRPSQQGFKTFVACILIIFLTFPLFKSDDGSSQIPSEDLEQSERVLGSRPPGCVNKCLSCSPCMPTLVVPPHQRGIFRTSSQGEDDGYYLLSWKCKCGNKIFQP